MVRNQHGGRRDHVPHDEPLPLGANDCRCGHSKWYHRELALLLRECFAKGCNCAQYRKVPS